MQGITGLYTAINTLIAEKEFDDRLAIDANTLFEEVKSMVDPRTADFQWYVRVAIMSAIKTTLNQKGYRSVVRENGIFVNPENCEKPEYLARLYNNAKLTEQQKEEIVLLIKKAIKKANIEGQLTFDFSTETIVEDFTEKQLIAMLKADAS